MAGFKIQVCAIQLVALPLLGNSVDQNGVDGYSGTIRVAAALHFSKWNGHKSKCWLNHDASIAAAAVGEKESLDKAMLNSEEIKPVVPVVIE